MLAFGSQASAVPPMSTATCPACEPVVSSCIEIVAPSWCAEPTILGDSPRYSRSYNHLLPILNLMMAPSTQSYPKLTCGFEGNICDLLDLVFWKPGAVLITWFELPK